MIALRILLFGSQAAFAAALTRAGKSTTARAVSGWEHGEYHPEEAKLPVIARLLHIPIEVLESWLWPVFAGARQADLSLRGLRRADAAVRLRLQPLRSTSGDVDHFHPARAKELLPGLAPVTGRA